MRTINQIIQGALLKLDVSNGDHWTSDGLPRLDVVKELVGQPVSRADITNAAKGFNRANKFDPVAAAEIPVDSVDPVDPVDPEADKQTAEEELEVATAALVKAQNNLKRANARMDIVIQQREDAAGGRTFAEDIQKYQASQRKLRAGKTSPS